MNLIKTYNLENRQLNFFNNIFKFNKTSGVLIFGVSLILLMNLASCAIRSSKPKELNCTLPEQNCEQKIVTILSNDTTRQFANEKGYYYQITPVSNINTRNNEYAITGFGSNLSNSKTHNSNLDKYAILTYEENSQKVERLLNNAKMPIIQNMRKIRFATPTNASFEGNIITNEQQLSHIGLVDYNNDFAYFTLSFFNNTTQNKLPLENSIGQSNIYELNISNNQSTNQAGIDMLDMKLNQIRDNINNSTKVVDFFGGKDTFDLNLFISHPTLHPNGRVMFFVSNYFNFQENTYSNVNHNQKAYSGNDIYMNIKNKQNIWSEPINCGNVVNSDCDEISPFITKDGSKMLYSSAGFNSAGGYDIFEVTINQQSLENMISKLDKDNYLDKSYVADIFINRNNLAMPINTNQDEIFPTCPADCDSVMYYSSNQNLINGFDIYVRHKIYTNKQFADKSKPINDDFLINNLEFAEELPVLPELNIESEEKITVEGVILNQNTAEPVEGASVVSKYKETGKKITETVSNKDGVYQLDIPKGKDIEIIAESDNLFYDKFDIKVDKGGNTTKIKMDFKLPEKYTLRINFPYDEYKEPYQYTLDSNGIETNQTWQTTIDNLANDILKSINKLKYIEIIGHTDDIASVEYNLKLGENRAKFVENELIKRGIPKSKLKTKSLGKSNLLKQRDNEDSDTYRKRLRRVTIEKITNKQ